MRPELQGFQMKRPKGMVTAAALETSVVDMTSDAGAAVERTAGITMWEGRGVQGGGGSLP